MKTKKRTRQSKECHGCGDNFITYRHYDYCANCAVNNNRYLLKSPCSECDGSGKVKFPHQPARPCKLCSLVNTTNTQQKKPMNKKLTPEEQYWDTTYNHARVLLEQQIISQIPFNPELVFELTNLENDNRYQAVIEDIEEYYQEAELPEDPKELAETIFCEYMERLIRDLKQDLSSWPPSIYYSADQ